MRPGRWVAEWHMLPSQTHCTHACSPGWAVVALGLATPRRSAPACPASGFRAAHSALGRPAPYLVSSAVRIGSPTGDAWLTSSVLAKVPDSTLHQSGGYRCHRRWRRNTTLRHVASFSSTTQRTGGPPVPKRRFHVQWVHIGMQGGGVCIRKISGSIEVTSGSAPKML